MSPKEIVAASQKCYMLPIYVIGPLHRDFTPFPDHVPAFFIRVVEGWAEMYYTNMAFKDTAIGYRDGLCASVRIPLRDLKKYEVKSNKLETFIQRRQS